MSNEEWRGLQVVVPVKTVSEGNVREHWGKKSSRHKQQKLFTQISVQPHLNDIALPCIVTFIRLGKRKLDSDNLQFAFKKIRDTVADMLIPGLAAGKADDDPRIIWRYDQRVKSGLTDGFIIRFEWILPSSRSEKQNGYPMDFPCCLDVPARLSL